MGEVATQSSTQVLINHKNHIRELTTRLSSDHTRLARYTPLPTSHLKVEIEPEEAVDTPSIREPSLDVICDFVNGHAFGNSIGIGLRSQGSWITVEDAYTNPSSVSRMTIAHVQPNFNLQYRVSWVWNLGNPLNWRQDRRALSP